MRKITNSKSAFLAIIAVVAGLLFSTGFSSGDATTRQHGDATSSRNSQIPGQNDRPPQSLQVSLSSYDFSRNPRLLDRIVARPHGYFRFINKLFSQEVCARFQDLLRLIPNVNLHGDAHLEQYAITDTGRGLTDFDDATLGPAILDLVRFGVSVHLACRANGWSEQAQAIVDAFLSGYRAALKNSELTAPPPELVTQIRLQFVSDRGRTLELAESLMEPLEIPRERFVKQLKQYVDQMSVQYPELPPHFFEVKTAGRLKIGIGSALDEKYLFRVEGPAQVPDDDIILEAKEVRDLHGISCILYPEVTPMRPMILQARIAYQTYRYAGFILLHTRTGYSKEKTFWVYEWEDNYRELSIRTSFKSQMDLHAIAYDVGVQLGLGHPKAVGAPYDVQVRHRLLTFLDQFKKDLNNSIHDLARENVAAWRAFRAEVMEQESHNRE